MSFTPHFCFSISHSVSPFIGGGCFWLSPLKALTKVFLPEISKCLTAPSLVTGVEGMRRIRIGACLLILEGNMLIGIRSFPPHPPPPFLGVILYSWECSFLRVFVSSSAITKV